MEQPTRVVYYSGGSSLLFIILFIIFLTYGFWFWWIFLILVPFSLTPIMYYRVYNIGKNKETAKNTAEQTSLVRGQANEMDAFYAKQLVL